MKVGRLRIICGALASVLIGATLAPVVLRADDTAKVIEYFRKKANLPANAPVTVSELKDSPIKGAKQGVIQVGSQQQPFLLSADGRYAVFSSIDDLTVNPYEEVMKRLTIKDRPTKGPKDARVTIVEFSEFQCPYCARGYQTMKNQVLKEYGDRVRLVFKHFPLQSIHPWAEPAAVATDCVFKQKPEAFWAVHDALFDSQREINAQNLKEKVIAAVAKDGIDTKALQECMDKQSTLAQVKADQQNGIENGVKGTPAFFINGCFLSGAQPFEAFKAIIDDELSS